MADHVLVTRGKRKGRRIDPSVSDAIRYWPICPQGHALTFRGSGRNAQWVCRTCLHAALTPVARPEPAVPPCEFCGDAVPLESVHHPWRQSDVLACPSCAQALRDATSA